VVVKTELYEVNCTTPHLAVLSGKMRLPSPTAYDEPFKHVFDGLAKASSEVYVIDIKNLEFLNSSGINALGRLVFIARKDSKKLKFVLSKRNPWQEKIIGSFTKLYEKLIIETI